MVQIHSPYCLSDLRVQFGARGYCNPRDAQKLPNGLASRATPGAIDAVVESRHENFNSEWLKPDSSRSIGRQFFRKIPSGVHRSYESYAALSLLIDPLAHLMRSHTKSDVCIVPPTDSGGVCNVSRSPNTLNIRTKSVFTQFGYEATST